MAQSLHQEERRQFEHLLRQQRVARIADRMKVVDAFLENEEHNTAQGWCDYLAQRGVVLEPDFVAETLELLTRFGLAERRKFEGGPRRYEHRHLGEHHDHLICSNCGAIAEFVNPELEALKAKVARDQGFLGLGHKLQIYGLCKRCQASRPPAMPLSLARPGERLKIETVTGGAQSRRQLEDMGLSIGSELEVISANGGPMVVASRGNRLALGRGVAHKVQVSHIKDE